MVLKKRVFIICSVRDATDPETKYLEEIHIPKLKSEGFDVHYPKWHTKQYGDPIGTRICTDNRREIERANHVEIYYNPTSKGSRFDTGMACMIGKPIKIINVDDLESQLRSDEFLRFLWKIAFNTRIEDPHLLYQAMQKEQEYSRRKDEIRPGKRIDYIWKELTEDFLFDFGMVFMNRNGVMVANREDLERERTPHKSFQNVLLDLDTRCRQGI